MSRVTQKQEHRSIATLQPPKVIQNPPNPYPVQPMAMGFGLLTPGWAFFAMLICVAVLLRTRTWLRLRHIPGPPFAGFSELWLLRKTLGGRCHLDTSEACKKYGARSTHRKIAVVALSRCADCCSRLNCPGRPQPARHR